MKPKFVVGQIVQFTKHSITTPRFHGVFGPVIKVDNLYYTLLIPDPMDGKKFQAEVAIESSDRLKLYNPTKLEKALN